MYYLYGGKSVEYNCTLVSARRMARIPLEHTVLLQNLHSKFRTFFSLKFGCKDFPGIFLKWTYKNIYYLVQCTLNSAKLEYTFNISVSTTACLPTQYWPTSQHFYVCEPIKWIYIIIFGQIVELTFGETI